jgi:hypothetical protein
MRSNRFKITLKGDEADESLRLSDLIEQLNAVKQTLNQIDVAISGGSAPGLYYRVTSITMKSPATFEVEAVPKSRGANYGSRVVSKFSRDIRSVIAGKRPANADLELLESYRSLAQPMRKHVAEVRLQFEKEAVDIPRNLDIRVEEILGPDQVEFGSVVGSLDVIDIHNQRNLFRIYPVVGPTSIRCRFRSEMLTDAVAGITHFVRITGMLHYKRSEKHPHFIDVSAIEVLPERSDANSLSNLRGIAPDAYGGLSSTEYVDKVRSGEW